VAATKVKRAEGTQTAVKAKPDLPWNLQVEPGTPPMKVNSQARVDNLHAAFADDALTSSYTNNADKLDNKSSEEFANATHLHSGADITSGTVAETRIDPSLARDNEIMTTVKANDGANSGVDADTLDSMDSSEFAPRAVEQWHQVGATNEPGFQNGWTNDGTFTTSTTAFYKDPWGVVHLKGLVKNGTVGSAIFALPCGYGTSERQIHTTLSVNNVARVDIVPEECGDGRHSASVVPVTGSNAWISLDGITFRAAGS
jgi:hypothetical protein